MFFRTILLSIFTLFTFLNVAQAFHILIDPGHGGRDQGALQAPYSEAEIAWAWSLELKKLLLDQNFEVELSRNETKGLSLSQRIKRLNQKKYDLILSLHANYILNPTVKGIEYYVAAPLDLEDQKLHLAHEEIQLQKGEKKPHPKLENLNEEQKNQVGAIINDLQNQAFLEQSLSIVQLLNQAWPGKLKQGPFDLLEKAESPAILIELGYLSNPQDLKNLIDPRFRLEKSLQISDVISRYFKSQTFKEKL